MRKIFFPSSKPAFVDVEATVKDLREIALKLFEKNKNIEAIYLFGSYSRGNAGLHSDADVLVVLKEDTRRPVDRLDEFILAFSAAPVPVDVLVNTRLEVESAIKEGNRFFVDAIEGMKLVERISLVSGTEN